ncbi:hypothetical protein N9S39_03265 [Candidatus Pelagibacter sp.]|nr:hypothetical protein [Candidatus Pelagibacter sp.]
MFKKITLLIILTLLTACGTVKDKVKSPFGKCPPAGERNITDVLCRETKD